MPERRFAMELAAVLHRPTAEFVYPGSRTGLVIRLFAARGDLDEVGLLYWERGRPTRSGAERYW